MSTAVVSDNKIYLRFLRIFAFFAYSLRRATHTARGNCSPFSANISIRIGKENTQKTQKHAKNANRTGPATIGRIGGATLNTVALASLGMTHGVASHGPRTAVNACLEPLSGSPP
jgi:hypothetical protein